MRRWALPALVLLSCAAPAAAEVRLIPVTREIADACRRAQTVANYPVLCPSRLPRGTGVGVPADPLSAGAHQRGEVLDFGYSAGYEAASLGRRRVEALNRPARFLHFVVGRATQGVPPGARPARLGGKVGLLAPGDAIAGFSGEPYFANHARFVWRERGVRYVATLHTFGERPTERLLGRIVAGLRPARAVRPLRPARRVGGRAVWVGPRPIALAATPTALWAASTGSLRRFRGGVTRVDPDTLQRQVTAHPAGGWETRVAAGMAGVWCTRPLQRVDRPARGPRLSRRRSVAALAVGDDAVWVAQYTYGRNRNGSLAQVDPRSRGVVASVGLPGSVTAVAVGAGAVWALDGRSRRLLRFDPLRRRVTGAIRVGRGAHGVAVGAGAVWLTESADGTLARVDPRRRRVVARIRVGRAPYGVTADARGVWVAVAGRGVVVRVDPATSRVVQTLPTGGDPISVATDDRHLWIGMSSDAMLVRVRLPAATARRP